MTLAQENNILQIQSRPAEILKLPAANEIIGSAPVWLSRVLCCLALVMGPMTALFPRGLLIWVGAISLLLPGYWLSRHRKLPISGNGRVIPALWLFAGYVALSSLWSLNPLHGLEKSSQFIILAGVGGLMLSLLPRLSLSQDQRQRVLSLAALSILIGGVLMAFEIRFNFPIHRFVNGLAADVDVGHNPVNRALVVLTILIWPATLIVAKRVHLALIVPILALIGLLAFNTECDSAKLGLCVALIILPLALAWPSLIRRLMAGGIILVVCWMAPLARWAYAHGFTRPAPDLLSWACRHGLISSDTLPFSARHRIEVWDFVAERIYAKPWLGWGLESSRFIENFGRQSDFRPAGKPMIPLHPHNAPLHIWLETGMVGVAMTVLILILMLRGMRSMPRLEQGFALATMAATLTMSSSAFGIWQNWWLAGFVMTGVLWQLQRSSAANST